MAKLILAHSSFLIFCACKKTRHFPATSRTPLEIIAKKLLRRHPSSPSVHQMFRPWKTEIHKREFGSDVGSSSWCTGTAKEKTLTIMMNLYSIHAAVSVILKLEFDKLQLDMIIGWCQYLPLTVQIRWVLGFLLSKAGSKYFALKFGENISTHLNYYSVTYICGHPRYIPWSNYAI